ncbi:MAG: hypothetical protein ACFFCS_20205 [Candidatus Hodarchaeota archaeon]
MYPKIKLENLSLSKIVCGTNQFVGITHRPNPFEIQAHKRRFKEPETVAKFMIHLSQEYGVNCCVSSPREKVYDAIKITEKETGEKFHWICSPSIRPSVKGLDTNIFTQIDWCVDHDVSVCMPHRIYTDCVIDKENLVIGGTPFEELQGWMKSYGNIVAIAMRVYSGIPIKTFKAMYKIPYPEISAYIRDKGMIPGLSTHYPESIKAVEKNGYDAPLINQPLNMKGYQSSVKPEELIKVIQGTKIQIQNIKPMAAGRLEPRPALEFCLKNIKKNDFLAVGFGKYEYCVEDGKILAELLEKLG